MNDDQGQAGIPAWPRLPKEGDEASPSPPISLPNTCTAIVAAVWLGVILFLPPGVTYFRNPPPPDLVSTCWIRFSTCVGLLIFDLLVLYLPGLGRRKAARLGVRVVHLVTAGWAILIGALLFINWVSPYPYLFGLHGDFFE